jgi:F-type H+-transporting ATPase subunit epsilon
MQLKILLPYKIFSAATDVTHIVAVTRSGSFGLLPQRLDCVASLSPGILTYSTSAGNEVYLAIDEGVLVKTGADVRVCVRHAIGGTDLGNLRNQVEQEFLKLDEQQKSARSALAQLESGFIRSLVEFQRA